MYAQQSIYHERWGCISLIKIYECICISILLVLLFHYFHFSVVVSVVLSGITITLPSMHWSHCAGQTATLSLNVNIRSTTVLTVSKEATWCIAPETRESDHYVGVWLTDSRRNGLATGPPGRATPIDLVCGRSTDRLDACRRPHTARDLVRQHPQQIYDCPTSRTSLIVDGAARRCDDGFITGPCSGLRRRCVQLHHALASASHRAVSTNCLQGHGVDRRCVLAVVATSVMEHFVPEWWSGVAVVALWKSLCRNRLKRTSSVSNVSRKQWVDVNGK